MFNFFRKDTAKDSASVTAENAAGEDEANTEKIPPETDEPELRRENPLEIPEHIFVEYEKPKLRTMDTEVTEAEIDDLQTLYNYLGQNLEKKGYEDALMNPDTAYMEENLRSIRNALSLKISKVKSYYNVRIKTIDFHIETRRRSGMVETVEELVTEKAVAEDEMSTVTLIEEHAKNGNGLTENLFLNYKKGFKNGFAAITYNTILNRKKSYEG